MLPVSEQTPECDGFHTSDVDNHCLSGRNMLPVKNMSEHTLDKTLKSLFRDIILSDIKLQTNSKAYFAHKCLLRARSLVLNALFKRDLNGNNANDTVNRLIQYVYTAEIKDPQCEKACNLYRAAHKHQILDLKEECSAFLRASLCAKNACEVLILADLYHDEELKTAAQNFILNNAVVNSEEWKKLMQSHAKLAEDTMHLEIQEKTKSPCNTAVPSEITVKFNQPTEADSMKGGVLSSIRTNCQCITCWKEHEIKSPEEFRAENYAAKCKGRSIADVTRLGVPAQQTSIFEAPVASSPPCSDSILSGTTQSGSFGGEPAVSNSPSSFYIFKDQTKPIGATTGTTDAFKTTAFIGTTVKFKPPTGCDLMMKRGKLTAFRTRHQCITCMKAYKNKSFEELRVEDYAAYCRGSAVGVKELKAPAQQTSIFGTPAASRHALDFGGTTQSKPLSTAGTTSFNTTPPTGTTVKFNPPIGTDLMIDVFPSKAVITRHQCITCMVEYKNKSLEELRVEDYAANRKGGSSDGVMKCGSPAQQTSVSDVPPVPAPPCSLTTQSKPLGTTETTNFPDNKLAPVLSELGSSSTTIPSALPGHCINSEKSVTASSELNSSNSFAPLAFSQFHSKIFRLSPTVRGEKSSAALSLSPFINSNKTPDKPSFSFKNECEKTSLPTIVNSSDEQISATVSGIANSSTQMHLLTPDVLNNSDTKAPPLSVECKSTDEGTCMPNTEIMCSTITNLFEIISVKASSRSHDFNRTKESTHFKSSAFVSNSSETTASIEFNNKIPTKESDSSILDIGKLKLSESSAFDRCNATAASASLVLDCTHATTISTSFEDNSKGGTLSTSSGLDISSAKATTSFRDNSNGRTLSTSAGLDIRSTKPTTSFGDNINGRTACTSSGRDISSAGAVIYINDRAGAEAQSMSSGLFSSDVKTSACHGRSLS